MMHHRPSEESCKIVTSVTSMDTSIPQSNSRQIEDIETKDETLDPLGDIANLENCPGVDTSKVVKTSFDESNTMKFSCSLSDKKFSKEGYAAAHVRRKRVKKELLENCNEKPFS